MPPRKGSVLTSALANTHHEAEPLGSETSMSVILDGDGLSLCSTRRCVFSFDGGEKKSAGLRCQHRPEEAMQCRNVLVPDCSGSREDRTRQASESMPLPLSFTGPADVCHPIIYLFISSSRGSRSCGFAREVKLFLFPAGDC